MESINCRNNDNVERRRHDSRPFDVTENLRSVRAVDLGRLDLRLIEIPERGDKKDDRLTDRSRKKDERDRPKCKTFIPEPVDVARYNR